MIYSILFGICDHIESDRIFYSLYSFSLPTNNLDIPVIGIPGLMANDKVRKIMRKMIPVQAAEDAIHIKLFEAIRRTKST